MAIGVFQLANPAYRAHRLPQTLNHFLPLVAAASYYSSFLLLQSGVFFVIVILSLRLVTLYLAANVRLAPRRPGASPLAI